jgi:hypothetical protein
MHGGLVAVVQLVEVIRTGSIARTAVMPVHEATVAAVEVCLVHLDSDEEKELVAVQSYLTHVAVPAPLPSLTWATIVLPAVEAEPLEIVTVPVCACRNSRVMRFKPAWVALTVCAHS